MAIEDEQTLCFLLHQCICWVCRKTNRKECPAVFEWMLLLVVVYGMKRME